MEKKTTAKQSTKKTKATSKSKSNHKLQTSNVKLQNNAPEHIGLVRNDGWLEPFEAAIRGRHDHAVWKLNQLTKNGKKTLSDFASGHNFVFTL